MKLNYIFILLCVVIIHVNAVENDYSESNRLNELEKITEKIQIQIKNKNTDDLCKDWKKYVCDKVTPENLSFIKFLDYDYLKNLNDNDPKLSKSEINLKNFIVSCEQQTENYEEQLKNLKVAKMIGGWPIFTENWNSDKFDLSEVFGTISNYGIFNVFQAMKTPKSYDVLLEIQPGFDLTEEFIYEKHFKRFNIDSKLYDIRKLIRELMEFNEKVKQFARSNYDYNQYELKDLKNQIPEFDWDKFFERSFGKKINEIPSFKIHLSSMEKLKGFVEFLNNYDKKVLANYVMWKMIYNDEFPWSGPSDCSIDDKLNVLGSVVHRVQTRKFYTEYTEKLHTEANQEMIKILNQLLDIEKNQKHSDSSLLEIIEKLKERVQYDMDYFEGNRVHLDNNDLLDSLYADMEMSKTNYLQNFYNYKTQVQKVARNKEQNNKVSEIFSFFRRVSDLSSLPSMEMFHDLKLRFWNSLFNEISNLNESKYFEASQNCLKDVIPDDSTSKMQLSYNEALKLAYKTYTNWLENTDMNMKENDILQKYGLNAKTMFLLYDTYESCVRGWVPNKLIPNDVVSNRFGCPNNVYNKCKIY